MGEPALGRGDALAAVPADRVALGVVLGLLVGEVAGILGAAWLAVRVGLAVRPTGLAWRDLAAVSLLGGVGSTVSLLLADLALAPEAAVLLASAAAALLASAALLRRSRAHRTS